MSDLQRINDEVFPQAFALLSPGMNSLPARAMLLAIGLQESSFTARVQNGGPAHGYWQFEQGGGVTGVLRHPVSRGSAVFVCGNRGIAAVPRDVYKAVINDDVLACCFARLLLYTLPGKLPAQNQREEGWQQYLEAWRPGAPHRSTWDAFYDRAWRTVITMPDFSDVDTGYSTTAGPG